MEGMWPLERRQLQVIQKLVEVQLEPDKFWYHLDGSSVVAPSKQPPKVIPRRKNA